MVSDTFISNDNDVKRIFLSDGANNETLSDVIVMLSNVNPIELYVNGVIKANILIKRIESNCGVYLKWFNQFGGYSYWLFEKIFTESYKVKELDELVGKWDNLQSLISTSESLGKTVTQALSLTTNFHVSEKDNLIDIIKAPKVEMYINQIPFVKTTPHSFLGVIVNGGNTSFSNKNSNNKLKINLDLPSINTITY